MKSYFSCITFKFTFISLTCQTQALLRTLSMSSSLLTLVWALNLNLFFPAVGRFLT